MGLTWLPMQLMFLLCHWVTRDCTNKTIPLIPSKLARKWSKLTCAINSENQATLVQMVLDHRPGLESKDKQGGKRRCMDICEVE